MPVHFQRAAAAVLAACTLAGCGDATLKSRGGPGTEYTYRVDPGYGTTVNVDGMAKILSARMVKLGLTGKVTATSGSPTVTVRVDGATLKPIVSILFSQAQLELYDLEPALVAPSVTASGGQPVATRNLYDLLSRARAAAKTGEPSDYYLFRPVTVKTTTGTEKNRKTIVVWWPDPFKGKIPSGDKVLPVPPRTVVITCSAQTSVVCPGDNTGLPPAGKTDYYLFKKGPYPNDRYGPFPNMTGKDLKLSGTREDFDPTTGAPVVLMQFTGRGNKIFHTVTKNEVVRGSIQKAQQHFAIVLDNEIRSWPQVDYTDPSLANGIDPTGSGAQITGMSGPNEAKNLALVLQTGSLPGKLVLVSERAVG